MTDKEHAQYLGDLLAKTEEQVENLKCCGNCERSVAFFTMGDKTIAGIECTLSEKNLFPYNYCEQWKWNKQDRAKKDRIR